MPNIKFSDGWTHGKYLGSKKVVFQMNGMPSPEKWEWLIEICFYTGHMREENDKIRLWIIE